MLKPLVNVFVGLITSMTPDRALVLNPYGGSGPSMEGPFCGHLPRLRFPIASQRVITPRFQHLVVLLAQKKVKLVQRVNDAITSMSQVFHHLRSRSSVLRRTLSFHTRPTQILNKGHMA